MRTFAGVLLAAALVAGCGSAGKPSGNRLTGVGLSVEVPRGWYGRVAKQGSPLPGAAIVYLASFPLPAGDDVAATRAERALGPNDVLLIVSETQRNQALPAQPRRINLDVRGASVGRHAVVDQYFLASGRAFALHATFGSRPPQKRLIARIDVALASLQVERRGRPLRPAPDPAPARVFGRVRLFPTPVRVLTQCRLKQAQTAFPILCPARLPRPFLSWPPGEPLPAVHAERIPGGLTIGYGGPWEPDSGPDWRLHLWRNRPCCFLHFELFRRAPGRRNMPAGARSASLGGRHGLLKYATSYGPIGASGDYMYWPNHVRFLWRENGVDYVASLHRFGTNAETHALLGRLIRGLRPTRRLRG